MPTKLTTTNKSSIVLKFVQRMNAHSIAVFCEDSMYQSPAEIAGERRPNWRNSLVKLLFCRYDHSRRSFGPSSQPLLSRLSLFMLRGDRVQGPVFLLKRRHPLPRNRPFRALFPSVSKLQNTRTNAQGYFLDAAPSHSPPVVFALDPDDDLHRGNIKAANSGFDVGCETNPGKYAGGGFYPIVVPPHRRAS